MKRLNKTLEANRFCRITNRLVRTELEGMDGILISLLAMARWQLRCLCLLYETDGEKEAKAKR